MQVSLSLPLVFSFDVGHSSIGWSVIASDGKPQSDPDIIDCGVVLFQKDSCLASKRRQYRRMRRNIRATRQRIARLKTLFAAKGILPVSKMDKPGHMAPFFLAARCLRKRQVLTAEELWHVLRWYAHNRGYDGNSRWSREEVNDEDTEKQKNAIGLMEQYGTSGMAETITAMLSLDLDTSEPYMHLETPAYRVANAAFPRRVVEDEVERILAAHQGVVHGLDDEAVRLIAGRNELSLESRQKLKELGIKHLPKRYEGNLLFGQLVPRFDNRIIARCPMTWAKVYDEAIQDGRTQAEAKKQADKYAKVPSKKSPSFLRYRFARVLANIRADGRPLSSELRNELFEAAQAKGSITPREIHQTISTRLGDVQTNVANYFELHPDGKESLVLDPARDFARKATEVSQNPLYSFYSSFPEELKRWCLSRWGKGKTISLAECLAMMEKHGEDTADLSQAMEQTLRGQETSKKKSYRSVGELAARRFGPVYPTGRASYAKPVLDQVVAEVLEGYDPSKPAHSEQHPDGEKKRQDGVLYALLNPESRVTELTRYRTMDELTNNHLVRHRMLILSRLVDDMVKQYAGGNPSRVSRAIVEVGREVSQFSGMTAKEIQAELNHKLRDFKAAVLYLQTYAPDLKLTGGLIRKCRIAMDMNWTCPFTSYRYTPYDLRGMEREHIIPYSNVKMNALHALVLTLPAVNKMKDKRTGLQFVQEDAGKPVPGHSNLCILTPNIYKKLVEKLDEKGHGDDRRRKKARKSLLMVDKIDPSNEREQDFTPGHLTQSSHLMKLAARTLKLALPEAVVSHIPGPVNAEIRKAWQTLGCLAAVAPDIIVHETKTMLPKDEIRSITHMHHALDAMNLAVAWHYIPGFANGALWLALLKRRKNEDDRKNLRQYKLIKVNDDNSTLIVDLPESVKRKMGECLRRERVMQHIPADRSGAITAETTWRILSIEGEGEEAVARLRQRTSTVENGVRKRERKPEMLVKAQKVLGAKSKGGDSKLQNIKGGIMIEGNFGIALDPVPTMIVHRQVHQQLETLRQQNGGIMPRIIRPYSLIRLTGQGEKDGVWIVRSLKATKRSGLLLDLSRPSSIRLESKNRNAWINVSVNSLMKKGLELCQMTYTGNCQQ